MPTRPFFASEHGYLSARRDQNIICICVNGNLNQETIARYRKEVSKEVNALASELWGVYLLIEADGVATPEAAAELISEIRDQCNKGRCATAIRLLHCQASRFVANFWHQLFSSADHLHHQVHSEAEAYEWLRQQIANSALERSGRTPE